MLEYIQSGSSCNNIKTFEFSTFYTTSPHSKLKDRLTELIQQCFIKQNGQHRYKTLCQERTDRIWLKPNYSTQNFPETDIINMLEFVIYNIFAMIGRRVFQQTVGIPMGTNCASLLADLFLYSHRGLSRKTKRRQPDPLISRSAIQTMSFH